MKFKTFLLLLILASALGYWLGQPRSAPPSPGPASGLHQSYFSQPEFFEQAFQAAALTPVQQRPDAAGVVVNHHLLASAFIAETFDVVASDQPITVLLVSPNHFDAGRAHMISSLYDWQTPYGVLPANREVIQQLTKSGLQVEEAPFTGEHGVSAIVPFIKKTLPQASVVPIILKAATTEAELERLVGAIKRSTSGRVVMVASVDFSHYLPGPVADFHDLLSKHVLRQFDFANISRLEVDSQPSIRLLLRYMQQRGTEQFQLLNHSNSTTILGNPEITEGTSYVTGYFIPGEHTPDNHHTFLVSGDIEDSPNLNERLNPKSPNYIFAKTERLFWGSNQTLAQAPKLNQLTKLGVNNENGFAVLSVDAGTPLVEVESTLRGLLPQHVIVSVQWRGLDQASQQQFARKLIESGADLVVGHGPDPGPIEHYQGKLIVYSLGTLVPSDLTKTTQSLSVGVDAEDSKLTFSLFALQNKLGQVTFIKPSESDILPATLTQQIYGR